MCWGILLVLINFVTIVLKKIGKTSKIAILGPNLHKKGVNMDHAQLSETFCFIKMSHILAE